MIVYDITSTPDFSNDTTLENLLNFAMEKGILLYDSSKGGDKPYYLGETKEKIKVIDTKGLDIKDFINDKK
jgi:hypothetical protein